MANEIIVMEQDNQGNFSLCFLYPIATPKQVNGTNIIVTPSSELPAIAAAVTTVGEKTALDNGTGAFQITSFKRDPTLTGPALLAKVQAVYALRKSEFDARYAAQYELAGNRYNAS